MDEQETKKFKAYHRHLDKQLNLLGKQIGEFLGNKTLDEKLLGMSEDKDKLHTVNQLAYLLTSLIFVQQKLFCQKDMQPVMTELGRVKSYMDREKMIKQGALEKEKENKRIKAKATSQVEEVLSGKNGSSSISFKNFDKGNGKKRGKDYKVTK